jgi:hypothetical protein
MRGRCADRVLVVFGSLGSVAAAVIVAVVVWQMMQHGHGGALVRFG